MTTRAEKRRLRADVAVAGAGLAGLECARILQESGLTVAVLEARHRVGGRVFNGGHTAGPPIELGAQWASPRHTELLALAARLGIETFATHQAGDDLAVWQCSLRRFRGDLRLPPPSAAQYARACDELARVCDMVALEAPWASPVAKEADGVTAQAWLDQTTPDPAASTKLRLEIESLCAAPLAELSLLHVACYLQSNGGLRHLLETGEGAQALRFAGGSHTIAERLAAQLREPVHTGRPVRTIKHSEGEVTLGTDGLTVQAMRAVIAIPPTLAGRIRYIPALPARRDGLTQRMAQGTVIKCIAVYDTPFWREDGLTGHAFTDCGPVTLTYDNSPPTGSPGVVAAFIEGHNARTFEAVSDSTREQQVLAHLGELFGPRARRPRRYVDLAWAKEEHTRGCYGGYLGPGGWTAYGPALRDPVGTLQWAGSETSPRYMGYMEGAVRSGQRAARAVLASLAGSRRPDPSPRPWGRQR
jgi:monoamine oxidase